MDDREVYRTYIEALRSSVQLSSLVEENGIAIKRTGAGRFVALCPFHAEKTPSFMIWDNDDSHYHCFGCGARGSSFDFVMRQRSVGFREAVSWLSDHAGIEEPAAVTQRHHQAKRERRELAERQRDEREVQYQAAAAKIAAQLTECAWGEHPYLVSKGLPQEKGMVTPKGWLMIPAWNDAGEIRGAQYIDAKGTKLFHAGSQQKGCCHRLGRSREVWLCEGYVTGLSVRNALRARSQNAEVRICFSAQNMTLIGKALQEYRAVYTVADNDASGTGEQCARAIGGPFWMPPGEGDDANDFYRREGLQSLARALMSFRYPTTTQ